MTDTYRILVTGSRHWTDEAVIEAALRLQTARTDSRRSVLVHGGCPTGADAIADRLWRTLHLGDEPEIHLPDWDTYGHAAGPIRNQAMVDVGVDFCLAFPGARSIGTWHTIRLARHRRIPVHVIAGDCP